MQKFLVKTGYKANGVVDGAVGDLTVEAIKAFQAANVSLLGRAIASFASSGARALHAFVCGIWSHA